MVAPEDSSTTYRATGYRRTAASMWLECGCDMAAATAYRTLFWEPSPEPVPSQSLSPSLPVRA